MQLTDQQITTILSIIRIFETGKASGDPSAVAVLDDGAGISYGIAQFTHRSGSLAVVVGEYLERGGTVAREALSTALPAMRLTTTLSTERLSADTTVKNALVLAGRTPEMREAQGAIAERLYLGPAKKFCEGRGFELPLSEATPEQVLKQFRDRDASGDIDRVLRESIPKAPAVLQAKAKLEQAEQALAQAELDLRYTEVRAEIDGVVARRSVNPGNYVQPGQQVMAVRSLTDIWVDCNFKETQLEHMRPGQEVEIKVDAYPGHPFKGRVDSVQRGSGARFSLLPPENATGNYVKVVQRVPVKIVFDHGSVDPSRYVVGPGMSVEPEVRVK